MGSSDSGFESRHSDQFMTLEDIKKEFLALKEESSCSYFAACFGKTVVDPSDISYKTAEEIGEIVIESNLGVLHGGYTGTMEAVSNGANRAIDKDITKNKGWNVGVPMKSFDERIKRADSKHLTPAENILDRKRILVDMCDLCVVLPVGGMGTLLEVLEIFHVNQINEKYGGIINPIIFYGDFWKKLFPELLLMLDMKGQSQGESFITYVNSSEELKNALVTFQVQKSL